MRAEAQSADRVLERLDQLKPIGGRRGANLSVALELARRLGPGKRVVTPLVDSGLKYLSGDLFA